MTEKQTYRKCPFILRRSVWHHWSSQCHHPPTTTPHPQACARVCMCTHTHTGNSALVIAGHCGTVLLPRLGHSGQLSSADSLSNQESQTLLLYRCDM